MPDWWKLKYGLDPHGPASINGPAADPDRDGRTNLQEYLFGTNPIVPDAGGQLTETRNAARQAVLTFPTIKNRLYNLQYADTLGGTFQTVGGDIVGTGGSVTFVDDGSLTGTSSAAAPRRFYRLQARVP